MARYGAHPVSRLPLLALLTANAISGIGNKLTALAIPWFVLETTGSATRTGVVGAAVVVPLVISAFFGGALVDRIGFRTTSILSDLLSGVTVILIPLLHQTVGLAFWQLLVLVLLGAILDAPGATARQSLFPDLANLADIPLERANAASQTIWRLSYLLGPPLAGVSIGLIGTSNVLWLDGVSFAISASLVGLLVPKLRRDSAATSVAPRSALSELAAGLRVIRNDRLIRLLAISSTLGNALGGALHAVILPVFARESFGDATALGLLVGGFGAGAISGAILYGAIGYRFSRRRVLIISGFLSIVPIFVLATTPPLAVAVAASTFEGLCASPFGPIITTVYQRRTPPDQRGRFFGAVLATDNATTPLALLLTGLLLDRVGLTVALITIAAAEIVVRLAVLTRPVLRQLDEEFQLATHRPGERDKVSS